MTTTGQDLGVNEDFLVAPLDVTRFVTVDNKTIATIIMVRSLEKIPNRERIRLVTEIVSQFPKELRIKDVLFGDYDLDFYQIRENDNDGKTQSNT